MGSPGVGRALKVFLLGRQPKRKVLNGDCSIISFCYCSRFRCVVEDVKEQPRLGGVNSADVRLWGPTNVGC